MRSRMKTLSQRKGKKTNMDGRCSSVTECSSSTGPGLSPQQQSREDGKGEEAAAVITSPHHIYSISPLTENVPNVSIHRNKSIYMVARD